MDNKNLLLVVSDVNKENRIKSILKNTDFQVEVAENPHTAIEMLKEKNYKVSIIVDDDKEIKSFALIHSINLMQFDVLCIIVANDVNADSLSLAYDLGTYDIIDENDIDDLVEIVKSV